VRGAAVAPDESLDAQWEVVDAFLAAAREGDFAALVAVLDPDVVLRADQGAAGVRVLRGAETVASQARAWSQTGLLVRRALVNGAAGVLAIRDGRPFSVSALTISGGRIVAMHILADPERLERLGLTAPAADAGHARW